MAPEQLLGREVTARSDIFALGLVLYELFTGRRAFVASTIAELVERQQGGTVTAPSTIVTALDPAVERAILRCLDPDPARRPASALAVSAALPGGDPLAAALAAGETPSPQMVAAAGESTYLTWRVAIPVFLIALAGIAAVYALALRQSTTEYLRPAYPPEVLAQKARDAIRALGYTDPPGDEAQGFMWDQPYIEYVRDTDKPAPRWTDVLQTRPSPLTFWYRRSHTPMTGVMFHSDLLTPGIVQTDDPPPIESGMIQLNLDHNARHVSRGDPVTDRDGARSDRAVELDAALPTRRPRRRDVETGRAPVDVARDLGHQGRMDRYLAGKLAAAAGGGRRAARPPGRIHRDRTMGETLADRGGQFAARRHRRGHPHGHRDCRHRRRVPAGGAKPAARARRSRRRAAAGRVDHRCAPGALGVSGARRALAGIPRDVPASPRHRGLQWPAGLDDLRRSRALRPPVLAADARLDDDALARRINDPVVGRDVLFGVVLGVAWLLVIGVVDMLAGQENLRTNPGPLELLAGLRSTIGVALSEIPYGVRNGLFYFFLLFIFRVLLRRSWAAAVAFTLLFTLLGALDAHPIVSSLTTAAYFGLASFAVLQWGLLSLIVGVFVTGVLADVMATTQLSAWYFPHTLTIVGIPVALAAWAFYTATGKRHWTLDVSR
jgi:hypothetical protein